MIDKKAFLGRLPFMFGKGGVKSISKAVAKAGKTAPKSMTPEAQFMRGVGKPKPIITPEAQFMRNIAQKNVQTGAPRVGFMQKHWKPMALAGGAGTGGYLLGGSGNAYA